MRETESSQEEARAAREAAPSSAPAPAPRRETLQDRYMVPMASGIFLTGLLPQAVVDIIYRAQVDLGNGGSAALGLVGAWGVAATIRDDIRKKTWGRSAAAAAAALFGLTVSGQNLTHNGYLDLRHGFNSRAEAVQIQQARKAREDAAAAAQQRAEALRADNIQNGVTYVFKGDCRDAKLPGSGESTLFLPRGCTLTLKQ